MEGAFAVFSVLCRGSLFLFRYSYPDFLHEEPIYSYEFTEYEWSSLLHVSLPASALALGASPRLDILYFYEGGASLVLATVEPRAETTLREAVYLHSVDFPLICKPETLDHVLHSPAFEALPGEYEAAPEAEKMRLLELFSALGDMELACGFVLRRAERGFVIRDLTVFLYFCDAELGKCEELADSLGAEFGPLVSGFEGDLIAFLSRLESGQKRLHAATQLLTALQARGAQVYSPSSIDRSVLAQSFQAWKHPNSALSPGFGGVYSQAKIRQFVSAVVTWTDAELLDTAAVRAAALRLKFSLLEWTLKHDNLAKMVKEVNWGWERRRKGKEREATARAEAEKRLFALGFPYIPDQLLYANMVPLSSPPPSLGDFLPFFALPQDTVHFSLLYLMLDLAYRFQEDDQAYRELEDLRQGYIASFGLAYQVVARAEGCWKLDVAYEVAPEDRKPLLTESLK